MPQTQEIRTHPFDASRLCSDRDYRVFSMLPVFALGIVKWAGQEPQAPMVVDGMRSVFWYWYTAKLPCCSEKDLADTAMAAAHEVALAMFGEEDIANQAQAVLKEEVAGQVQPGGCDVAMATRPGGGMVQAVPPHPQRAAAAPGAAAVRPQATQWESRGR